MSRGPYKPGDFVTDRYRIKAMIGSGGFGRVYRAFEERLGRDVALKIMMSGKDSSVQARFAREAQLVAELNHPHIVTLYDYETLSDDRLCLALEYVEGTTLDAYLQRRGTLSANRIHEFGVQILDALAEAHAAGVLHRDLKPTNLMVVERHARAPHIKLLDFGIAKKVASEQGAESELTSEGQAIGTRRYMSPEQLDQLPLTPASDLFGVGLLIYEMWSGESPFWSSDTSEIYRRIQRFDDDLGALSSAPQPLKQLSAKLLHPAPDHRFASAEIALEQFGDGIEADTTADRADIEPANSVPASFPVGLDRRSKTPSSELTGTDLSRGALSGEARRQLGKAAPTVLDGEDHLVDADNKGAEPEETSELATVEETASEEVTDVVDEETPPSMGPDSDAEWGSERPIWKRAMTAAALLVGVMVAGGVIWWFVFTSESTQQKPGGDGPERGSESTPAAVSEDEMAFRTSRNVAGRRVERAVAVSEELAERRARSGDDTDDSEDESTNRNSDESSASARPEQNSTDRSSPDTGATTRNAGGAASSGSSEDEGGSEFEKSSHDSNVPLEPFE